jgi:hypothetical protein
MLVSFTRTERAVDPLRLADRFAHFEGVEQGQTGGVRRDGVGSAEQDPLALARRQLPAVAG